MIRKYLYGGPGYFMNQKTNNDILQSWKKAGRKIANGGLRVLGWIGDAINTVATSGASSDFGLTSPFANLNREEVAKGREQARQKSKEVIEKASPYISPANHVTAWTQGSFNPMVGAKKLEELGPEAQFAGALFDIATFAKGKPAVKGTIKAATKATNAVVDNATKAIARKPKPTPLTFNKDAMYRIIGEEGYLDAIQTLTLRPNMNPQSKHYRGVNKYWNWFTKGHPNDAKNPVTFANGKRPFDAVYPGDVIVEVSPEHYLFGEFQPHLEDAGIYKTHTFMDTNSPYVKFYRRGKKGQYFEIDNPTYKAAEYNNQLVTIAPGKGVTTEGPRLQLNPPQPLHIGYNLLYAIMSKVLGKNFSPEEFAGLVEDIPIEFIPDGRGKGFTAFRMTPAETEQFVHSQINNAIGDKPYHDPPFSLFDHARRILSYPDKAMELFPSTGIVKTSASPYSLKIMLNTVFPRLQANRPWMKDVGKNFDYGNIYEVPDAYFEWSGKESPAFFKPKTGNIVVNDHVIADANIPHELRHRADAEYPYTEFEQQVTSKAFEGFENAKTNQNYDMSVEIPPTILESRNFLLSKYLLHRWLDAPLEVQNKILAKVPDYAVFHAIERSNGYGARFINYLRETNQLTPERAEALRQALIYGAVASPFVMHGINLIGMVDKKKKGGKTHKPFGHRSVLDNGWQSTKQLKNKKNVYGK